MDSDPWKRSCCEQEPTDLVQGALCVEMPDGKVPDWVDLIPAGPVILGNDGRGWRIDNPEAVVTATQALGRDPVVDWEHATMKRWGPPGRAPAAGWIKELRVENGMIRGRVEWTAKGRASVEAREYRYLSPVFDHERQTGQIIRLVNAGLTNIPNLRMRSLNQERGREETEMNEHERICQALGLPTNATNEQVLTAINKLQSDLETAANRETVDPPLDRFVPRADYDRVLERATAAETSLDELRQADLDTRIDAAMEAARKAGKITPATEDYHRARCREEGGLEAFQAFVEAAPEVAAPSRLSGNPPAQNRTQLDGDAVKIAGMFGHTEEQLKKYD